MNPIMVQTRNMESVSLYSEARTEYLKQLAMWIIPPLVEFFKNEYELIKLGEKRNENASMASFQKFCAEVPKWNQDIIDTNVALVLDNCRCDYVEELMTAVFIAHTKMLTAIRVNSRNKKLQITLPKLDHFLHRVYIECARSFWKSPYIFSDEFTPIERQKNILQAESMCIDALSGAVRSLLPVKSILQDYLDDDDAGAAATEEVVSEDDEVVESVKPVAKSVVEPVAESIVEHVAEPVAEPVVEPVAEPVGEPVAEPVAKSVVEPKVEHIEKDLKMPAKPILAPISVPIMKTEMSNLNIKDKSATVTVMKSETEPGNVTHIPSNHTVTNVASVSSMISVDKSDENPILNTINIDTEPVVHFTPYDTVYDDNSANGSEIRFSPKISVEDKPVSSWGFEDIAPKIKIHETGNSGSIDSIDLEPNVNPLPLPSVPTTQDVDIPLSDSADFLELN